MLPCPAGPVQIFAGLAHTEHVFLLFVSLQAAMHCAIDDRAGLEQLCNCISRAGTPANEGVHTDAAGEVLSVEDAFGLGHQCQTARQQISASIQSQLHACRALYAAHVSPYSGYRGVGRRRLKNLCSNTGVAGGRLLAVMRIEPQPHDVTSIGHVSTEGHQSAS